MNVTDLKLQRNSPKNSHKRPPSIFNKTPIYEGNIHAKEEATHVAWQCKKKSQIRKRKYHWTSKKLPRNLFYFTFCLCDFFLTCAKSSSWRSRRAAIDWLEVNGEDHLLLYNSSIQSEAINQSKQSRERNRKIRYENFIFCGCCHVLYLLVSGDWIKKGSSHGICWGKT